MKRNLLLLPLLLLAINVGCVSVPVTEDIATVANLAAYTGTVIDLEDNPDHRPFYNAALAALDGIVESESYSPASLASALADLPVKELNGRRGTLIVGAAVTIYTRALQRIDVDQVALAKSVTLAVRDGLANALGK